MPQGGATTLFGLYVPLADDNTSLLETEVTRTPRGQISRERTRWVHDTW